MAEDNFIDFIKINCRSGHGGAGSVHFHRDRSNPMGGPDGGDGGRGGHIILRGDRNKWTLLHLRYQKHVIAENGGAGGASQSTGASGKDIILDVPLGTIARDAESNTLECEILEHGQEKILVEGGIGGRGNTHFKSATRQAPRYAQPGTPGRDVWKILELKVLADVGLVGFPNAGKSTLLSVISAAKPKIGAYPFTTLKPNLGIVAYRNEQSFVMADIPGIIEGASEGKGLGLRFLRHIERNAVLLFMIPCDVDDPMLTYTTLENELRAYNPELCDKPRVVAITKCDLIDPELQALIEKDIPGDWQVVFISAVAQIGLDALKDRLWDALHIANDSDEVV
ncbi:MAG: GTPase ObgE [Saprospiraceae bacterium]|nr:GTPase ObgE [Saprospiraceae bacterium]